MKDLSQEKVGLRTVAVLTGLDRDSVRTAIVRAELKPAGKSGGHDTYLLTDVLKAIMARRGDDVDPALLSPVERRAHYDAELKRQEFMKRQNQLLPRSEVEQSTTRAFFALREALLNMPDRLERQFALGPDVLDELVPWFDQAVEALGTALDKCHAERPLILG